MGLLTRLREYFGWFEYQVHDHYIPAVDFQDRYTLPVTVIKGPYSGLTFSFENVNWNRVIEAGGERMVATYNVKFIVKGLRNAALTYERFRPKADEIFTDYMAFIVENHNKLKEQVLKDNTETYPDEEYRTDDIEEFSHPRIVHKEGIAVPTSRVRTKQKRTSASRRDHGVLSKVQPPTNKDGD